MTCPAWIDARFRAWALLWAAVSLLAYGLVAAIIPNPVFGRQVPPEPFAIAIWLLSAPLMGIIGATYSAPIAPATSPLVPVGAPSGASRPDRAGVDPRDESRATLLGSAAGFGAFLAIGCPVCNKIALLLLGASGAMTVWAPIQPILGAVSLALLVVTVAWRLRQRATGATCAA